MYGVYGALYTLDWRVYGIPYPETSMIFSFMYKLYDLLSALIKELNKFLENF